MHSSRCGPSSPTRCCLTVGERLNKRSQLWTFRKILQGFLFLQKINAAACHGTITPETDRQSKMRGSRCFIYFRATYGIDRRTGRLGHSGMRPFLLIFSDEYACVYLGLRGFKLSVREEKKKKMCVKAS